jgi:hypothetical protein
MQFARWNDATRRVLTFAVLLFLTVSIGVCQNTDDYRSRTSGNWNNSGTWQRYNVDTWTNNPSIPDVDDGEITIRDGHTVTVNARYDLDELVVKDGSTLTVAKRIRLQNGPDVDLTHDGTIQVAGENLVLLTGASAVTSSTGILDISGSSVRLRGNSTWVFESESVVNITGTGRYSADDNSVSDFKFG